jgi:hypothetical protein
MSYQIEISDASVGEAHAELLKGEAPEPFKQYIRACIGDLVEQHGNDVRISYLAQGGSREWGAGARVEVQGEAADNAEEAPTVAELIDQHYLPHRSKKLVSALKRINARAT